MARPREISATAFLAVSDLGQEALNGLLDETRALLSLSSVRKSKHFPAKVAFNLFPGILSGAEVERQLSALFGEAAPALAVQTLQAGLFHGVAVSMNLRVDKSIGAAGLRGLLAKSDALTLVRQPARLGTLDAAGADRILVGDIRESAAGTLWLWATMDNLAIGAANAVALTAALLESGPPA